MAIDKIAEKIIGFFNVQPTVVLVIVAVLSLSISFFTAGLMRVLLGLICVVCSFVIMQRAIAKSVRDRWGYPDKK
jgi:hypothetical protein